MKKLFFLIFLLPLSCNFTKSKFTNNIDGDARLLEVIKSHQVDFAIVKRSILEPKCISCHSSSKGNQGEINLETYNTVINNLIKIKSVIEDGSMPKDGTSLSSAEKQLILEWINNGAPFNVGDIVPPLNPNDNTTPTHEKKDDQPLPLIPEKEIYSFENINQQVLIPKCLKCHKAPENSGKVNLESYESVIANIKNIEIAITDGSMPKRNSLTISQKQLILNWIKLGAPLLPLDTEKNPAVIENPEPQDSLKPIFNYDSETLRLIAMRGKYLFNLSSCLACHTENSQRPLAGGRAIKSPFGTFLTPNITPDIETGIGSWSASDFLKAMRLGKSPSNQFYFPVFPYTNYSKLTDEDILAIYTYIKTLPPIRQTNKSHLVNFPYNQRFLLAFWRPLFFQKIDKQNLNNYFLARGPYQIITEKDLEWNRGAYLVEGSLHCSVCHTPRNYLGGLKTNQWMAGSETSGEKNAAPNITSYAINENNGWTAESWDHFLLTAQKPNGDWTAGEMKNLIRSATSQLTASDRQAVIKYLMSLPSVKSKTN